MFENQESQLELFEVANAAAQAPRREIGARLSLHLRHDQLILVGIAGVIAFTVMFACGVERGKQLARAERSLLPVPTASAPASAASSATAASAPVESAARAKPKPETSPAAAPKLKTPVRVAAAPEARLSSPTTSTSRYAVQLASYSQPQLAKRALAQLQAKGERAFLIMREGRTIVYVGPFPSKGHASEKVADLKVHYQDCFVRSL